MRCATTGCGGDRKSDLTLDEIDRLFDSRLWKQVENANVSGGEPTTRNDLVEICQIMLDKLPSLRKFGINTTGLTPRRAIPMLTRIVEATRDRGVIFSARVSIDGIGDVHNTVRRVKSGFDKANETIHAMQAPQRDNQQHGTIHGPHARQCRPCGQVPADRSG